MYEITYGARYDKSLTKPQIAKAIRADLKAAFPAVKFSVRCQGHNTIVVTVTGGVNAGELVNPAHVAWNAVFPWTFNRTIGRYTAAGVKLLDRVTEIVEAYNFDGSDVQTDYFNVNFYTSVKLASEVEAAGCAAHADFVADVTIAQKHDCARAAAQIFAANRLAA